MKSIFIEDGSDSGERGFGKVIKHERIWWEEVHKRIPESGRSRSAGKSFRNNSGRRVLCEFKVSAGPCTRAKVANDSLGV